jgi:uncharacterized protein YdhG (YjbR/CyaY superfamily)
MTTVDDYLDLQPPPVQPILHRVRETIRKALPKAEEGISYKMPTYKMHGAPVIYFAAWRKHYSLYPASGRLLAAFKDDLVPYDVNKSTIRFAYAEPVPAKLIERLAKFRAKEVAER